MNKRNNDYILAVDDTPASLRLLTDILAGEGYLVRSAINGELALHAAIAQPPRLILLDVNMPGMDGFEVCRRLKQEPILHDVPVIFVSALSEMPDKLKGFEIGGVDYVTKPFQRDELLARVHTHLQLYNLTHHLEEMVEERTRSLKESEQQLKKHCSSPFRPWLPWSNCVTPIPQAINSVWQRLPTPSPANSIYPNTRSRESISPRWYMILVKSVYLAKSSANPADSANPSFP
jgi:CheY-like chemotaxis protein